MSIHNREVALLRLGGDPPSELNIQRAREAGSNVHKCVCMVEAPLTWFVCYDINGKEIRRYNADWVSTVVWMT